MLNYLSNYIPSRPTHPILEGILLDAKENELKITGFDLSKGLMLSAHAEVERAGKIVLTYWQLQAIVHNTDAQTISIETIPEETSVQLTYGNNKCFIPYQESDEYPELPKDEDVTTILSIDKTELQALIDKTAYAASTGETKQVITGVNIAHKNELLCLAATNGHRLAYARCEQMRIEKLSGETDTNLNLTVRGSHLNVLNKILAKADEILTIEFNDIQVYCTGVVEDIEYNFFCSTLNELYPQYTKLIPSEFKSQVTFDKEKVQNSLGLILAINPDIKEGRSCAVMSIFPDRIQFSTVSDTVNVVENIPASSTLQEEFKLGINGTYFKEGLRAFDSKEITMKFNEPNTPLVFEGLGETVGYTYLIMPVSLRE